MSPARLQQIQDLYHSAREREPGERGAFLAEACGLDAELQREVESLLAQNGSSGGPMQRPAISLLAKAMVAHVAAGELLGPYKIESLLGAGGMGQVFKARDIRLGRTVAIKIAYQQFNERFEREAHAISSLNHTNICTLHDVGPNYLVMELVEGPTLAERIKRGPIPLEEALRVAKQIADALEAAHEKGIVHRDLKPANIKIRPDGSVKVLDFGLAKAVGDQAEFTSDSPTVLSESGLILGTAGYMSPEQARGQKVDKRADNWAFGVVLYEMLTGKRLFQGEDPTETLASVVKDKPDLCGVPAQVWPLLNRCLEKDPKKRLRDIGDAMAWVDTELVSAAPLQSRLGKTRWAAAVAVPTLLLSALALVHFREEQPRLVKLSVLPPESATIDPIDIPALSPDGRRLAFHATRDGKSELWVRDLDSLDARPLPGTEGAISPFWSPDSRSLAFFTDSKLKKLEIAGGSVLTLCDVAGAAAGGTWSRNGVIVFAAGPTLVRVSAAGGTATPLTGRGAGFFPWFLPDGHRFLYEGGLRGAGKTEIYVGDIDSKDDAKNWQRVSGETSNPVYAPPGYLLFARGRTLMAQPFDAVRGRTTGDAMPVAEQVENSFGVLLNRFSVSQNGVLAYISSGALGGTQQLAWVDRSGKTAGAVGPPGVYNNFRLAPDDKGIAFDRPDPQSGIQDVWVMDLIRGVTSRFTFDPAWDGVPIWSPDGLRILFPSNRAGLFDLYVKAATGAGREEVLVKLGTPAGWGTHWSLDGRFILYQSLAKDTGIDLWIAPQFGDRKPFPYLNTKFNEEEGSFSPDGRWIAYVSDESGREEVYVQAFPLSGAKRQISAGGGSEPNWRTDGTELFYVAADRNLMAVPIKAGATVEAGVPKSLFPITANADHRSYAVANDGQRFLVSTSVGAVPITVVLNWQAGLKK
jgi:eukaryotic-like serine/threonine-protein kinase